MRRGRSLSRNESIAVDASNSTLIAIFVQHSTRCGHRTIISQSNARGLLLLVSMGDRDEASCAPE
jgi:hypothetical protein